MAIDLVSESVQRQERPIFSLKDFKNLSISDDILLEEEFDELNHSSSKQSSLNLRRGPCKKTSSESSSLFPPLKSARYCKKQKSRNSKSRGISASVMLMHESSINHQRVSSALNDLSAGNGCILVDFAAAQNQKVGPFWSRRTCQEFWDDYLECDTTLQEFSRLSLKEASLAAFDDTCPQACYIKICKSIRKLLRRTFTGAPTFAELETLVKNLNNDSFQYDYSDFSCGQILNSSESTVTVKLETPFHRVWLHALCQYHGLSSQSKTVDDQRLVHINKKKKNNPKSVPRINLYNFLMNSI